MAKLSEKHYNKVAEMLHQRYMQFRTEALNNALEYDLRKHFASKTEAIVTLANDLTFYYSQNDPSFDDEKFTDKVFSLDEIKKVKD